MCENAEKVKSKLLKYLLATLKFICIINYNLQNKVCVRDLRFWQNINYVRIIIENIVFLPK